MLQASTPVEKPEAASPGPIQAYVAAYRERYSRDPRPQRGWIIATQRSLQEVPEGERSRLLEAYVWDDKPFLCGEAHSLKFFPGEIDRLRAKVAGNLPAGVPRNGSHAPRPSFTRERPPSTFADIDHEEV